MRSRNEVTKISGGLFIDRNGIDTNLHGADMGAQTNPKGLAKAANGYHNDRS